MKPKELYQVQRSGVDFLVARRRAYLADIPGFGKTVTALAAATEIGVRYPTVVCPAIAVPMWKRMWPLWGDTEVEPLVMSYGTLARRLWKIDSFVQSTDLLIMDEWHRCKSPTAKRTLAGGLFANRMDRVWLLSGSPMPNHPGELYTTFRAVWPDLLRQDLGVWTYAEFEDKFCIKEIVPYTNPTRYRIVGGKNMVLLRETLNKIMLRRDLDSPENDIKLPPLRWQTVPLDLTTHEYSGLAADVKEIITTRAALQEVRKSIARHRPSKNASGLARVFGTAKAYPAARFIADELEQGMYEKVVVIAHHHDVLDVLYDKLKRFGIVEIDGHVPSKTRELNIEAFQNDPAIRVFLGQDQTVGETITLTSAHEIIIVEPPWGPEDVAQIARRIHRIGQLKACRARMLVVPDSLDDATARVRKRKLHMIGEVVQ